MIDLDNKLSFFSGFTMTSLWTIPLYEVQMALILGIVGGIGGVMGKFIVYEIKKLFKKNGNK